MNTFKIVVLSSLFCLLLDATAHSQVVPPTSPPSANATALGIYGEYPISYASGVPDISIPLYEIKTPKLHIPIGLSYHANGIKVHEAASNVGLGFTLNAGGAITRQINGFDDFGYNGFSSLVIPDESITTDPLHPVHDEMANYEGSVTASSIANKYDGQPDNFFFNFINKSGKFMLKNTVANGGPLAFVTLPYQPMKINYDNANGSFSLRDNSGILYVFGRSITNSDSAIETTSAPTAGTQADLLHTTAWFLTAMVSADNTDTVYFKYGAPVYDAAMVYTSKTITQDFHPPLTIGDPPQLHTSTGNQVFHTVIDLQEIDFRGGKAVFEYNARADHGVDKVSRIRIYQSKAGQFSELRRFNFSQSYFTSQDNPGQLSTDVIDSRLRLDSISEEGVDPANGNSVPKPPYVFDYYTYNGQIACLGEYGQDLWGYWNGASQNDIIISKPDNSGSAQANRLPDSSHLLAGTVKTIQYPTSGKTEFQFEPNQNIWNYTAYDTAYYNYTLTSSSAGGYGPPYTDVTFTAQSTTNATFQGTVTNGNCTSCVQNQTTFIMNDLTLGNNTNLTAGVANPGLTPPYTNTVTVSLIQGHQYRVYYPVGSFQTGERLSFRYNMSSSLTYNSISTLPTQHTTTVFTGGLRVKKIINEDVNGNLLTAKGFNYLNPYYIAQDVFQGDFDMSLRYQFPLTDYTGNKTQQTFTENMTIPLAGSANGGLAYQEVEEYSTDNNGNTLGKTVYDFNQATDDNTYDVASTKTDRSWQRNQMIENRVYKYEQGTYTLLKDTKNRYIDTFPALGDTIKSWAIHPKFVDPNFNPSTQGIQYVGLVSGPYVSHLNSYYSEPDFQRVSRNILASTVVTDYDQTGANPIAKETDYFYNNGSDLMVSRLETQKSNSDKEIKRITYNTDNNPDQCFPSSCNDALMAKLFGLQSDFYTNGTPVYSQWQSYVSRRDGIESLCSSDPTNYNTCLTQNQYDLYDQQILSLYNQYQTLLFNYTNAFNYTNYNNAINQTLSSYNQCQVSYNTCHASQFSSSAQDIKGRLQMQQNNQVVPVKINYTVLSATDGQEYLAGADSTSFQFIGSSAEPSQKLIAEFPTSLTYSNYGSAMGQYLKPAITYNSFNNGNLTQYIGRDGILVTYLYGYNSQYPVAKVSGNTYAAVSALVNQSTLDNPSDDATLRTELAKIRNGLAGTKALVTTYTYSPLIGMTSLTDPSGRTTYYEYDGLGRLKTVKDEDGNVLKTYDYQYQN